MAPPRWPLQQSLRALLQHKGGHYGEMWRRQRHTARSKSSTETACTHRHVEAPLAARNSAVAARWPEVSAVERGYVPALGGHHGPRSRISGAKPGPQRPSQYTRCLSLMSPWRRTMLAVAVGVEGCKTFPGSFCACADRGTGTVSTNSLLAVPVPGTRGICRGDESGKGTWINPYGYAQQSKISDLNLRWHPA